MSIIKVLHIVLILIPIASIGQINLDKKLMKHGIEETDIIFTNESILLYPRGFIYNINEPDSVYYLGCLSSDIENIKEYFDIGGIGKIQVNNIIIRSFGEANDTILMESLEDRIQHFITKHGNTDNLIKATSKYVIIYYWCNDMLDRQYLKNMKFLKEYANNNLEKNIQILFANTDNK